MSDLYEAPEEGTVPGKLLTPEFVAWEAQGQEETGILKSSIEMEGVKGSNYYIYTIERKDGTNAKFSLGSATDRELDGLLHKGKIYRFIYRGKKALEGRKSMKVFSVYELAEFC